MKINDSATADNVAEPSAIWGCRSIILHSKIVSVLGNNILFSCKTEKNNKNHRKRAPKYFVFAIFFNLLNPVFGSTSNCKFLFA